MRKSLTYYIGNGLVILSLLGFVYIFHPLITAYFFPPQMPAKASRAYALWIPKIHAAGAIIPDVDPWNEAGYKEALKRGIAQGKGFAKPGEKGIVYLFAHSSGTPWELTRYNSVFLRLGELENGDTIIIWHNNKEYTYAVTGKKEVDPRDVNAVTQVKGDQLIIQTCTPIGTDLKRLLVFAKEVKKE